MLLPEPKHTPANPTPHPQIPTIQHPIPPRKPIQPLEIIPAPADGKSEKHAVHLNPQRRAMGYY